MIKINLLPSSIYEKRIVRSLMVLFAIIIVATATAGIVWKSKLDTATADMAAQATAAEAEKARIAGIQQQAQSEMAKIAPIAAKLGFIKSIEAYNTVMPSLYQELAKYTYKGVLYRKVTPSATGLQIDAYTPSLGDLGRFLLNMYKADSIFSSVTISAVPGYPAAKGVSEVTGGGPMMGGYPGMGGGYPSMGGGYPGMSTTAGRYGGLGAITSGVSKTIVQKGFNFTVSCTLKTPIAAPAGPGGAAPGAMPGAVPGAPSPMPGAPMPGPAGPMPGPSPMPGPALDNGGQAPGSLPGGSIQG